VRRSCHLRVGHGGHGVRQLLRVFALSTALSSLETPITPHGGGARRILVPLVVARLLPPPHSFAPTHTHVRRTSLVSHGQTGRLRREHSPKRKGEREREHMVDTGAARTVSMSGRLRCAQSRHSALQWPWCSCMHAVHPLHPPSTLGVWSGPLPFSQTQTGWRECPDARAGAKRGERRGTG